MVEEQKNNLLKTAGKYLGSNLVKQEKGYTKMKFIFEIDGKSKNFFGFMPWTKKDGTAKKGTHPDSLKLNEFYDISYSEYKSEQMDFPSKTAVSFFHRQDKPKLPLSENLNLTNEELDKGWEMYSTQVPKEQQSKNHFIGTMFRHHYKDLSQQFVDIYDRKTRKMDK